MKAVGALDKQDNGQPLLAVDEDSLYDEEEDWEEEGQE